MPLDKDRLYCRTRRRYSRSSVPTERLQWSNRAFGGARKESGMDFRLTSACSTSSHALAYPTSRLSSFLNWQSTFLQSDPRPNSWYYHIRYYSAKLTQRIHSDWSFNYRSFLAIRIGLHPIPFSTESTISVHQSLPMSFSQVYCTCFSQ